MVDVWQARLADDEERLRNDQARLAAGSVALVYVLRDQAEVAASRQELTNAQRDLELALLQLKLVMGVDPASRLTIPAGGELGDGLADLAPGAPPSVAGSGIAEGPLDQGAAALVRQAEQQRPELRSAGARVQAARAATTSVRGEYGLQVNLFAMTDVSNQSPSSGVSFGAIASLPIFNGGQRRARIDAAAAERRRQETEREQQRLEIAREVMAARVTMRAARQNVDTAAAGLTAAQEEHRLALVRYEAGRSAVVEVLDALAARVKAEANVIQARYELGVAGDQLRRALGEPLPGAAAAARE